MAAVSEGHKGGLWPGRKNFGTFYPGDSDIPYHEYEFASRGFGGLDELFFSSEVAGFRAHD